MNHDFEPRIHQKQQSRRGGGQPIEIMKKMKLGSLWQNSLK